MKQSEKEAHRRIMLGLVHGGVSVLIVVGLWAYYGPSTAVGAIVGCGGIIIIEALKPLVQR